MTVATALEMNGAPRTLQAADLAAAIDIGWTLFAGCLVFFMQAGFSLLEVGFVREKNMQSILMKNVIDTSVGAVGWFLMGYGLAFGKDSWSESDGGGFVGTDLFFVTNKKLLPADGSTVLYDDWFFQFTFCATAATIVSGALAERCKLEGYIIFSLLMCLVLYPIVVHWTWGGGFLAKKGYLDFAGSGVVHMFGGVAAVTGAIVCGPRKGRFTSGNESDFAVSSALNVLLGTFILWFGWYGFNAGSTTALSGGGAAIAARCCVTTTMSAACGGLINFFLASYRQGKYDVCAFANGILGGLVGITAGCSNVDTFIACLIGMISGLVVELSVRLLNRLHVDDPIGAFSVHGACGAWGVIAAGLFDLDKGWWSTTSHFDDALGPNLVGIVCICAWAMFTTGPIFFALKYFNLLRVSEEVEELGLDSEFVLFRAGDFLGLRTHSTSKPSLVDAATKKSVEGMPLAAVTEKPVLVELPQSTTEVPLEQV